jgi:tRNA (guanine-N1)-methyltransferase
MRIDAVTIFPDYFAPLKLSLLGKAQEQGLVEFGIHDLRAFSTDNHNTVDDTPYGRRCWNGDASRGMGQSVRSNNDPTNRSHHLNPSRQEI